MTKTHIRRLPVCRGRHILGVIYISDVFYEIYKHLLA
jgi:signal-transduction protein with cAMP-binding, CBS, and nucleotidyltransferase domain